MIPRKKNDYKCPYVIGNLCALLERRFAIVVDCRARRQVFSFSMPAGATPRRGSKGGCSCRQPNGCRCSAFGNQVTAEDQQFVWICKCLHHNGHRYAVNCYLRCPSEYALPFDYWGASKPAMFGEVWNSRTRHQANVRVPRSRRHLVQKCSNCRLGVPAARHRARKWIRAHTFADRRSTAPCLSDGNFRFWKADRRVCRRHCVGCETLGPIGDLLSWATIVTLLQCSVH